jgi:hypothetical protein
MILEKKCENDAQLHGADHLSHQFLIGQMRSEGLLSTSQFMHHADPVLQM